MKSLFGEYYKIILYTILGLMIIMSSYIIILNIHHYHAISLEVAVSDIDSEYKSYIDNVLKIEDNIDKVKDSDLVLGLNKTIDIMKNSGVFRLIPKTKLSYRDLYELNDYFLEKLVNDGWVKYIKPHYLNTNYDDDINILINNAKYLNKTLNDNGLIMYDVKNDRKIIDEYHFILKNYEMFSKVILNISNIGGDNG